MPVVFTVIPKVGANVLLSVWQVLADRLGARLRVQRSYAGQSLPMCVRHQHSSNCGPCLQRNVGLVPGCMNQLEQHAPNIHKQTALLVPIMVTR